MRRQAKHRVISDDPVSDDVFYHHEVIRHLSSPSKTVELEEFGMFLHQAVLQLTPKQREGIYSPLRRGSFAERDCSQNGGVPLAPSKLTSSNYTTN